jgi:hypothetical protein
VGAWVRARLAARDRLDVLALVVALAAGVCVFLVSTDLFTYHSVNDDEGVYLLQAAMLLDGQLFLRPAPAVADLVRPWFFVTEPTPTGPRMYSKYAPVPAAMFALGRLVGDWHLALAAIAAANAFLTYLVGRAVADRAVGVVAAGLLTTAPLFLLSSSVFLPYAPTAVWNLAFAVAYLRAVCLDSPAYGLAAGVAIGVAFFARPYTAVLFATPFVVHAVVELYRGARESSDRLRLVAWRTAAIAGPGLGFVAVTLGYNAIVTGQPTTFPYEVFAPRDGLGFGRRSILGYTEQYTPALGYASTVEALSMLATRFAPLGALGTALAAVGVVAASRAPTVDREGVTLLGGLVGSVVVGNVYFWGTLNGLRNGLIDLLGPFYHFDLLLPLSVFGALGAVTLWRRLRATLSTRFSRPRARLVLLVLLVVSAPVVVGVERSALAEPWSENRQRTASLAATYQPFDREFTDALIYTPDPYGDWQQHPFQYLRNDPGFDGAALFVLDQGPDDDVRALDATRRTPYRFTYRGEWTGAVRPVEPRLVPLDVLDGDRVAAVTTVGVPAGATAASIRLETEDGFARYRVDSIRGTDTVEIEWTLAPDGSGVTNHARAAGASGLSIPRGASEVDLVVRFATTGGSSVTYRQEATVDATGEGLRVLWPPETRVCRLQPECGTEGTWVGSDGEYLDGVSVETDARVVDEST